MKRIVKLISNFLIGVLTIFMLVLLIISFFSKDSLFKIGKYSFFDVNGSSMYPVLKDGDFIAVDTSKRQVYEIGDIIAFSSHDKIIVHEIVNVNQNDYYVSYNTEGINTGYVDDDIVIHDEIIGEYRYFKVPLLGYVVRFANTRIGYLLLVLLPLGVMLTLSIYELIKEISSKKEEV